MTENIFRYLHRVTYAECTVGNHIYYSRYLDLLEAARGDFFRKIEMPLLKLQEQEMICPVVEAHMRYKAPARYDDLLTIELWLTELGPVRLNFAYRILNQENKILLDAETWHVWTGMNGKPKRAPEILIAKIKSADEKKDKPQMNTDETIRLAADKVSRPRFGSSPQH
ncbi:MAG: acyl-CoA thioesterase [Verrucomicrobiota bacterium]|nr:acyl-CoA thioesterase [Verrucomicrobiota bacterium]